MSFEFDPESDVSPQKDPMIQKALEGSVPMVMIYIRLANAGPLVMGGMVEAVLATIPPEKQELIRDCFNSAIEVILNKLANSGEAELDAVRDSRGLAQKINTKQDLEFFDLNNVLEEE